MPKSLQDGFIQNGWQSELPAVYARAAQLLDDHADASPAKMTHLRQLLPCIAFYEALLRLLPDRAAALAFVDKWAFVEVEKMVRPLRLLMRTGLYRVMPALCGLMQQRLFGEAAGFACRSVPDAPPFACDVTLCPYHETCKRYGYPELTQFACRADDVIYGNLHPRLVWARTQTLGSGGDCCDFRLRLRQKEETRHEN